MRDDVRMTITRLCMFFIALCSKVIDTKKLDDLENEGYTILCQLEMHFPPSFFDISVNLIAHLVKEIRFCGSIYLVQGSQHHIIAYADQQIRRFKDTIEHHTRYPDQVFWFMLTSEVSSISSPPLSHHTRDTSKYCEPAACRNS